MCVLFGLVRLVVKHVLHMLNISRVVSFLKGSQQYGLHNSPLKQLLNFDFVGYAFGRLWQVWVVCVMMCLGRILGRVWEMFWIDAERCLESFRKGV